MVVVRCSKPGRDDWSVASFLAALSCSDVPIDSAIRPYDTHAQRVCASWTLIVHVRQVELNVVEQCLNLYKTDAVQRRRLDTYYDPAEPTAYPVHALLLDALRDDSCFYRTFSSSTLPPLSSGHHRTIRKSCDSEKEVLTQSVVAAAAWQRIHGLVFDPKEGLLHKLPIDFKAEIARYRDIYDLYPAPQTPAKDDEEHYMLKKPEGGKERRSWMDGSSAIPERR